MLKKILLILACVEVSLLAHEMGHFAVMRQNGVEVQELCLGIGPLLYQRQFDSFTFSIKLIPITAYVRPSQKGIAAEMKLSIYQQTIIDLAGVFVNLFLATPLFVWLKLRQEGSVEALKSAVSLPKNYFLIFKDLLLETISFGHITPKNQGALVIAEMPGVLLYWLLYLNVLLGIGNLLPISMLDGGHVFQTLLLLALGVLNLIIPVTAYFAQLLTTILFFVTTYMLFMLMFRGGVMTKFVVVQKEIMDEASPHD